MKEYDLSEIKENLEKRRISANVFSSSKEVTDYILDNVKPDSIVGIGGSVTIGELELDQKLQKQGCSIYWHFKAPKDEVMEHRLMNQRGDYYLISANAITRDGRLVNTDGTGNRVSSMIFGPKKVLIIAGKNKNVDNLDEAIDRVKNVAAPKNARRQSLNLFCAVNDECGDCSSPRRMCNVTTIIEGRPRQTDMEVLLVDEILGY